MTSTEKLIINTCRELGDIAESNCHYTAGLARLVDQSKLAFKNMTINDFLVLARGYSETFNKIHSV